MRTSEKRQRVGFDRCQKCDDLGHSVILIGGYSGTFCDRHINEWHEIVINNPAYEDFYVKKISHDTLIRGGVDRENSRDLSRKVLEHQAAFYILGKIWADESDESDEVTETQDGLYRKYYVSKTSGDPIDPKAVYFPLRLDKDPHARSAARIYADSVMVDNPTLSNELHDLVDGIETEFIKKSLREKT